MLGQNQAQVNLNETNNARRLIGLKPLHKIWCGICHQEDNHWYFNCPYLICELCYGHHLTSDCDAMKCCQFCGSTHHVTAACTEQETLQLKAAHRRVCALCHQPGHIAKQCRSNFFAIGRRVFRFIRRRRRRRGYGRRRRRYRRRR